MKEPGNEGAQIMARIKRLGIEVTNIINIHGHFYAETKGYLNKSC